MEAAAIATQSVTLLQCAEKLISGISVGPATVSNK